MAKHPGTVAVAVTDGIPIFELAVPCEIFGIARPELYDPWYEFRLCAADPGLTSTSHGFVAWAAHDLSDLVTADTVVVPACRNVLEEEPPLDLIAAVREAHRRGARVVSICTGAFVLAAAGLLDGRPATTHWMHAELLAERHPNVKVDPSVLYVDDGEILTSAGSAAALDLCLHILRRDLGSVVANAVARRIVMPSHRPGGQAQYIETPLPDSDGEGLAPLLEWISANLDQPHTLRSLARKAGLTTRTLIRRFHSTTGMTPQRWLLSQRLAHTRQLLESTDLSVERIAEAVGLGSAGTLRRQFARAYGIPPGDYRRSFRSTTAAVSPSTISGTSNANRSNGERVRSPEPNVSV
jgi:AraC family transcriptional regulator, transcriptional activator FtrA